MKILQSGYKKCYIMNKTDNNKFMICRVLNEYNDEWEADEDLIKLLTNKISEEDLLKKFNEKKGF